jgi:tryptophan synthase beta chain
MARAAWPRRPNETASGRAICPAAPIIPAVWASPFPKPSKSPLPSDDTKYALGSVLNHVCLHQTVVGQEAMEQMAMADDYPDVIVGCTGGGSNFAGIAFPFLGEQLRGGRGSPRSSPSNRRPARR